MATVNEDRIYSGKMEADGTITVRGRGPCIVRVRSGHSGGDFGGGTISVQDQLGNGQFDEVDVDGTDQTLTSGENRTWRLNYPPGLPVTVRLDLAGATDPDLDVFIGFGEGP